MSGRFEPHGFGIVTLLPTEITIDIISRIPFDSILHCRQVCKTWRNVIHHPSFTHALHLLLRRRPQLLLDDHSAVVGSGSAAAASGKMGFIFLDKNQQGYDVNDYQSCEKWFNRRKEIHYVEYNVNDEIQYCKKTRINLHIPGYPTFIVGSCNGLICIAFSHQIQDLVYLNDPIYICNPITRECVNLPRFQQQIDINRRPSDMRFEDTDTIVSGFGYHHSTNEYKVVRIYYSYEKPTVGTVEVYTLGSGNGWRNKGEVTYYLRKHHFSSPGIFSNGVIHWLDHDRSIVAFELGDEEFRLLPTAPWFHPDPYAYEVKLRLFQGSLCVVRCEQGSIDIWTLKKNNEWECMFTINTRILDETNHSWTRMFNLDFRLAGTLENYMPFAHTDKGQVLLCYCHRFFCVCNPKFSSFESIVDYNTAAQSVIPHMNSFVSLRALLEEEEAGKMIGSVERVTRKYYQTY